MKCYYIQAKIVGRQKWKQKGWLGGTEVKSDDGLNKGAVKAKGNG